MYCILSCYELLILAIYFFILVTFLQSNQTNKKVFCCRARVLLQLGAYTVPGVPTAAAPATLQLLLTAELVRAFPYGPADVPERLHPRPAAAVPVPVPAQQVQLTAALRQLLQPSADAVPHEPAPAAALPALRAGWCLPEEPVRLDEVPERAEHPETDLSESAGRRVHRHPELGGRDGADYPELCKRAAPAGRGSQPVETSAVGRQRPSCCKRQQTTEETGADETSEGGGPRERLGTEQLLGSKLRERGELV